MEPVSVAGNRLFVMATLAREEGGVANICPEFLDYYGQITLGPESGLPVCWLDFEKWIAYEGLAPYHRENDRFLTQVMTLTQVEMAKYRYAGSPT
jgi:hypothetical protein